MIHSFSFPHRREPGGCSPPPLPPIFFVCLFLFMPIHSFYPRPNTPFNGCSEITIPRARLFIISRRPGGALLPRCAASSSPPRPPHRVGLSVRGEMRIAAMIRDREFSILNSPNQCVRFCMFFIYLFFLRFHLLPSIQVGRENAREGSLDNSCPPLRGRAGGGGGEGGGTRIRVQTACTDSIRRFCEISKRV